MDQNVIFQLNKKDFSELSNNKDLDSNPNIKINYKFLDNKKNNSYIDSTKEQREKLYL